MDPVICPVGFKEGGKGVPAHTGEDKALENRSTKKKPTPTEVPQPSQSPLP